MMIEIQKILNKIAHTSFTGSLDIIVDKVLGLQSVSDSEHAITWCSDKNTEALQGLNTTAVVIVSNAVDITVNTALTFLIVENPRRTFQQVLTQFFNPKREANISVTATIAKDVKMGSNVFIGHGVVIEQNCTIGDDVTILHNTVILKDTVIGDNVSIGSNNTIGGVGFGYEKNESGDFELIPHIGNVIIHNQVDVGNNTCIDRAVLGSTILHENVKIDNLVHIAHGVIIGRNSVVIANAMVAGSVIIGENTWVAPSSAIINKKTIGDNALIGLGAVVTKNVNDNDIVVGNPAKPLNKKK
jgi:UDP-3-O-[3-hydroxymyristoyl] glucosamine N-acyltransferase